jgi:hypothetical protein
MTKSLTRRLKRQPAPSPTPLQKIERVDNDTIHPNDRAALRLWLADPITLMALGIVENQRPSIMHAGVSGTVDERRHSAERRLTQLQGWETFRNLLLGVAHTPQEIQQMLEESYPTNQ